MIALYHRVGADRIIAEVNQGGQMVESTIRAIDPNVPYKGIHPSRGKHGRAEPLSAVCEQGRIHHVGTFPVLEDELCSYDGSGNSPNHLDAHVHAFSELMTGKHTDGIIEAYRRMAEEEGCGGPAAHGPALGLSKQ